MFRNVTLKCLNEIAGVPGSNYDDMFIAMYTQTMTQLEEVSCCYIRIYLSLRYILWLVHVTRKFPSTDAACQHKHQRSLCMWPRPRAELYSKSCLVLVYIPPRKRSAHRKEGPKSRVVKGN